MNRRIKEAEKSSTKAKLTFSNCGFEDQHVCGNIDNRAQFLLANISY